MEMISCEDKKMTWYSNPKSSTLEAFGGQTIRIDREETSESQKILPATAIGETQNLSQQIVSYSSIGTLFISKFLRTSPNE